jgi:hypothetical protein
MDVGAPAISARTTLERSALRRWCDKLSPRLRKKLAGFDLLDRRFVAASTAIEAQVTAWEGHLKAKGTGEKRRQEVAARVRAVIAGCKFKTLLDVDAATVEQYVRGRRESEETSGTDRRLDERAASGPWGW